MKDLSHTILWSPPHCSKLLPIELFLSTGKNHVALEYKYDMKMVDVVCALKVRWYVIWTEFHDNSPKYKYPVDCRKLCWYDNWTEFHDNYPKYKCPVDYRKLWLTALKYANEIYVPICDEIDGTIRSLSINENHTDEPHVLPIDTLVIDLTKDINSDADIGHVELI